MAEKITRKQALTTAIDTLNRANFDGWDIANYDETVDVLNKMLASLSKPRKATVSKARKINENLAKYLWENAGEVTTAKEVVALGNPEILSTQKATAVLKVATELGYFAKEVDGKKITYKRLELAE